MTDGVDEQRVRSARASQAMKRLTPGQIEMSEAGLRDYWSRKNVTSIDGLPTGIFEDV